ncbi:type VI secretion system-associated FHA domain protein TagH [soil metagenome]
MLDCMIVLTVQSFNGTPVHALSASFDEMGGTVGRSEGNNLVLADSERSVSRVHARVVYRNGGYALIDEGSNAVLLNDTALGRGHEAPIRDGDVLQIGAYRIAVAQASKAAAADPFADLFGAAAEAIESAPPLGSTRAKPPAAPPSSDTAAMPSRKRSALPTDWDPFAPDLAAAPAAALPGTPSRHPAFDMPIQPPSGDEALDALFSLQPGGDKHDPMAGTPLAATTAPNTAGDVDPLRALSRGAHSAAPLPSSHADHVSDLKTPWIAPRPSAPPLTGAVLSWDHPSRERTLIISTPKAPISAAMRPTAASDEATQPSHPPSITHAAPAPQAASPSSLSLALSKGLGTQAHADITIDDATMTLIGSLLREATQGVVDLLQARAAFKREMRSDVTMVVARDNNPLKFSPTVDVALQHLLGKPTPGFMGPTESVHDAFDDLRAHQLGVMAGMRSALDGVLQRFDPAVLESKLTRRSPLTRVLPSSRKARLWELFEELYSQLSSEASDDFQALFGKAFRIAYEAHLDQLQSRE